MVRMSEGLLLTAVYVAPVTGIPVLLFSGFFVNFDTIPKYMQWLSYVSYARYSWEGTVVAIYGNKRGPLECKDKRCIFENSKDVLDAMDVEENALFLEGAKIYFDAVVLVLFFITLRLASYLVLRYKVKSYH
ncbi:ATP-binding cassette sub-family G member 4 [Acropora cervicornis]|uniref:ATP-binding cassette sub-family G member 4 n=1 Tax=Acropora cervicornis TaxID=6130 RepID=A0AAD9QSN6_ACRCE|nr:ATP-binding cassette sub-family G member 4 [Acropora cervicornis]